MKPGREKRIRSALVANVYGGLCVQDDMRSAMAEIDRLRGEVERLSPPKDPEVTREMRRFHAALEAM